MVYADMIARNLIKTTTVPVGYITGKNIIVAIMITFCFTATLFMMIPIRSANSPYNPWVDINDDDKIGLQDLVMLANSYGTTNTENLTRNVNVTNWPVEPSSQTIVVCQNFTVLSEGTGMTPIGNANVTGYRYVSFFIAYYDSDGVDQDLYYRLSCLGITLGYGTIGLQQNFGYYETGIQAFEVGAPSITFKLYSYSAGSTELTIVLYCYN